MDILETDSPAQISVGSRLLRLVDSGMTQTLLGIIGGLTGTFLDGRYFVILAPLIPAAIHRNKVLEGVDRPKSTFVYFSATILTVIILLWFGTYLNHSRSGIFTPSDYAQAVKKILPVATQPPEKATALINQPSLPRKEPPRFTLTSMSISNSPTAIPDDIKTFSTFHLHLQNAGEVASHNLEIQVSMMARNNGRFPIVTQRSYLVDVEPGRTYDADSDQVVIDKGLANQVIRIWLRYKNLENPKKPIDQFIYQLWEGNRSGEPSPRFGDIGLTEEEQIKKYFDDNVKRP